MWLIAICYTLATIGIYSVFCSKSSSEKGGKIMKLCLVVSVFLLRTQGRSCYDHHNKIFPEYIIHHGLFQYVCYLSPSILELCIWLAQTELLDCDHADVYFHIVQSYTNTDSEMFKIKYHVSDCWNKFSLYLHWP